MTIMRSIFLLISLLASASAMAQIPSPANLTSPLQDSALRQATYLKVNINGLTSREARWDEKGHLLEDTRSGANGPWQRTTHEYDEQGNRTRSVEENIEYRQKSVYTYSDERNYRVDYLDSAGLVKESQVISYDEEHRFLLEYFTKPSGEIIWGIKKKLDEHGNETAKTDFYSEEEMNSENPDWEASYEYRYDQAGRITEQTSLEDGKFTGREFFVYDDSGRMTETTFYYETPDNLHSKMTFRYNERGDVIYWSWDQNGTYGFSKLDEYEYNYDDRGNWIVRTMKSSFTPSPLIVKRTIKYLE
jgi:YD repeat-containing protein